MLNAYLIDPISIKYLTALDQWNVPTFSTVAVMARVEFQNQLIRNAQGEQVVAVGPVILPPDIVAPTNADRIIIDGVEHAIMRVDKKAAFSISHYEVYIQ